MYTVTQNFLSILCSYSGQTVKYLETGHPITGIFGRYGVFNIDRYICGPAFFDENEEKRIERRESDETRLSSFFKVIKLSRIQFHTLQSHSSIVYFILDTLCIPPNPQFSFTHHTESPKGDSECLQRGSGVGFKAWIKI